MTVEEVRGSLDLTDNGAIKNSIRNCLTVFQNDPVLQGAVRYNILTERIDIVKPLWWSKQTATLTDTDLNYLMLYLEDKYSLTSEKKIQKALSIIADSNKYHPGQRFVQMRSEQTKNPPPSIILHESGAFVTQTALGFDGEATRKMRTFLQGPKPELLHHQKFFENGTAERAKESGTEQNYNMIDGCVNNVPKKPRRIGGRWSVLDRLHIKQAERRQKDNAPQQEQERSRKS